MKLSGLFYTGRPFYELCCVILLCVVISGCNKATGPLFHPIEAISPDKTVVYLYYPPDEALTQQEIILNGSALPRLDPGGYYPYLTFPGPKTFQMKWNTRGTGRVLLNAEGGHAYFLKVYLIRKSLKGALHGLQEVTEYKAIEEIQNCRLMQP
jgi:hypothetical protein